MDFNQAYERIRKLEDEVEAWKAENVKQNSEIRAKIDYNIKLRDEVNDMEGRILRRIEVQANQTGNKGLFMRIRWLFFGFDGKPFITPYR